MSKTADFFRPLDSNQVPRYAGQVSFLRLPSIDDPAKVDIALVGVPWDGGTTNRAGARHGPREMRAQSMLIRPYHHVTKRSPYDVCRVADLGDTPVNPIDAEASLGLIQDYYARLRQAGATPLSAGGDHLVTLPILRAFAAERPLGLVQFDAHSDTNDVYFGGSRYTHGTVFRRAIEEGLVDPKRTVQIGIRGTRYRPEGSDFANEHGVRIVYIEEFLDLGVAELAIVKEDFGDVSVCEFAERAGASEETGTDVVAFVEEIEGATGIGDARLGSGAVIAAESGVAVGRAAAHAE